MQDLYYRRVWQHINGLWQVVAEGHVRGYGMNCSFEGPTYCSIAPPQLYERWWQYLPATWGTGGTWSIVGEQGNWI
jgi:hypothetical protein